MKMYKLGARAPSDIHLPLSKDSYRGYQSGEAIVAMVRDAPRVARVALRVSNFVTRKKKATWKDYYRSGF